MALWISVAVLILFAFVWALWRKSYPATMETPTQLWPLVPHWDPSSLVRVLALSERPLFRLGGDFLESKPPKPGVVGSSPAAPTEPADPDEVTETTDELIWDGSRVRVHRSERVRRGRQ